MHMCRMVMGRARYLKAWAYHNMGLCELARAPTCADLASHDLEKSI